MIYTSKGHISIAKVDLLIQLTFGAAAPWPWAIPVLQGEPLARTGVNGHAAVEVATLRLGVPAALGVRSAGTLLTHKAKKHVAPRALSPVVELEVSVFVSGGLGGFLALVALALALGALALALAALGFGVSARFLGVNFLDESRELSSTALVELRLNALVPDANLPTLVAVIDGALEGRERLGVFFFLRAERERDGEREGERGRGRERDRERDRERERERKTNTETKSEIDR